MTVEESSHVDLFELSGDPQLSVYNNVQNTTHQAPITKMPVKVVTAECQV